MKQAAVIFVSHSMPQVAKVCNRGILLNQGQVKHASDNIATVIDEYYDQFTFGSAQLTGNQKAVIRGISITHTKEDNFVTAADVQPVIDLEYGRPLIIKLLVDVDPSVAKFNIIYTFTDVEQKMVAQCFSNTSLPGFTNIGFGSMLIWTNLDSFPLNKGKYTLTVTIREMEEKNDFAAVLVHHVQMVELRVTYDAILGAAPVQFDTLWRIEHLLANQQDYATMQ